MPSGGDQSPPPPPPPPAAAASDEEEDDDGEAEDAGQPARSPAPQTQQRFDELCSRLNMDEAARAEAWDSYRSMSESYTLEVRPAAGERLSGPGRGGDGRARGAAPAGRAPVAAWRGRGPSAHPRPGRLGLPSRLAAAGNPSRGSSLSAAAGEPLALKERREAGVVPGSR